MRVLELCERMEGVDINLRDLMRFVSVGDDLYLSFVINFVDRLESWEEKEKAVQIGEEIFGI